MEQMGVMSDKQSYTHDIRVRIPAAWKKRLESQAKREVLDVSDIVRRAIDRFLKSSAAKPATGEATPK